MAIRFGAALGTALKRGARVVASRESAPAYQMIKRAIISGLHSTGVEVADLRTLPAPVGKHHLKTQGYDAAFHVGAASTRSRGGADQAVRATGHRALGSVAEGDREALHAPGAAPCAVRGRRRDHLSGARARDYANDLLSGLNVEAIREREFRIVVDYGYSAASWVLPLVTGPLGVEAVTAHAFESDSGHLPARLRETIEGATRLVPIVNADFGAVFDRSAERLFLIDEKGREVPLDQTLLLYLRLIGSNGHRGKVAVPINTTSQIENLVGDRLEVVRTRGLADRADAGLGGARHGVRRRGRRRVRVSEFLAAYDAMASLCKLLELLATQEPRKLSELVRELPKPTLIHRQVACPWGLKGTVMRLLNERFADANVDLRDGIKIFDERGWVQVLPDPDEPLVHLYAEGATEAASEELEAELERLVDEVVEGEEVGAQH